MTLPLPSVIPKLKKLSNIYQRGLRKVWSNKNFDRKYWQFVPGQQEGIIENLGIDTA